MLKELSKMEQRYQAVMCVLVDGLLVTEVAEKFGVSVRRCTPGCAAMRPVVSRGWPIGRIGRCRVPIGCRPRSRRGSVNCAGSGPIGVQSGSATSSGGRVSTRCRPTPRPAPDLDPHLVALQDARDTDEWITRKVSVNGVITVAWQQISVGKHRERRRVDVHVLAEILEVWDGNELIKTVKRTSTGVVRKKRAQSD